MALTVGQAVAIGIAGGAVYGPILGATGAGVAGGKRIGRAALVTAGIGAVLSGVTAGIQQAQTLKALPPTGP